ncbi:hypothetical protein [Kribbella italica]|uniref:Uncharacterized protein n=1 Tax=Kribbella italica TaxID=1540520 RepID=A0A7W9MYJ6_9ACTN|nr:hypothetical protein [Kribbella italica]MBB5840480.1 hypothetical protein [Kribbella italica]
MHLTFEHDPRGESRTLIRRADGAEFELTSYSRKHAVPHDLVHAVVERELGIPDGIYGCIAAGAVFSSMTQTGGKKRRDAKVRSARILEVARGIGISETLVGVFFWAYERGRAPQAEVRKAWGVSNPGACPYGDERITRTADVLGEVGATWQASAEPLVFPWPTNLLASDGQSSVRRARGRTGRVARA